MIQKETFFVAQTQEGVERLAQGIELHNNFGWPQEDFPLFLVCYPTSVL